MFRLDCQATTRQRTLLALHVAHPLTEQDNYTYRQDDNDDNEIVFASTVVAYFHYGVRAVVGSSS